jgi:hypothetical protein
MTTFPDDDPKCFPWKLTVPPVTMNCGELSGDSQPEGRGRENALWKITIPPITFNCSEGEPPTESKE